VTATEPFERATYGVAMVDDAPLMIESSTDGAGATITLSGELDVHTAPQVAQVLDAAFDAGATSFVIDTAKLRFCDSSGIQVLVQARERALAADGSVRLTGVHGTVEKVLSVTALLELFSE
jgi:anti-anti-sigma factor